MTGLPDLPAGFDVQSEFPITRRWNFLNHAGVAPISRRAYAAIEQFAREACDDAYLTGHWYRRAEEVRKLAARLIHASSEEIAFTKNTSEGLAFVANGMDWKSGERIISTAVEYPSNVYPWMDVARRFGVEHVMVGEKQGRIEVADILSAADSGATRLIALSHVEYASGFRHNLKTIGEFCRSRGILLCVDGIQACGAIPVDVGQMHIDYLSADGHKWMLGPEGAGIFYIRRELLSTLRPEVGWMNVINASDYGTYDFTLRPDARRFECGSYNIPGVLGLGASLELILEVGITLISERILFLINYLYERLADKGYSMVSSRNDSEQSGILSFTSRAHDQAQLVRLLEAQRIIVVLREGRIRASPHFYNSIEDMDRLADALPEDR